MKPIPYSQFLELMPDEMNSIFDAIHEREIAELRALNEELRYAVIEANNCIRLAKARPCMRCHNPTLTGALCIACR